jgi:parallel beta-helix repeat protein
MGKITFAAALVACVGFEIASAEAAIVVVSKTIQAAVDEANPGDIILVPPGTYRETVRVLKDGVTILGSKGAVIDASGFANGIHVGADIFGRGPNGIPVCPAVAVRNFTLIGLTVQNAVSNGIFLSGVDTYTLSHGTYLNNGDYGTYPSCSNNGQINFNYAKGGGDTCIYVGNDVEASIIGNVASDCTVGVQIVNSDNVIVRGNVVTGNSTGVPAIVDPFNPRTETSDVLIATNRIDANNRPNTSTEGDLARIPSGAGVLILPPYSSRSGGLPGRRSSTQQTTGLHRTMAKVCKSDGQGTFAGTQGNGEVAPIAVIGRVQSPRLLSTQAVRKLARSICA